MLSESAAGTRERSSQSAKRKGHRLWFVRIRVPAAAQLQEGVYIALGEVLASRPQVGNEATGVSNDGGEVGVDLSDPSSHADIARVGKQWGPFGDREQVDQQLAVVEPALKVALVVGGEAVGDLHIG